MTIREAIWQYAEAKDLGCIMLDAAGHATVTRKPRGGLGVWATFSGAKKVARFINRKPVASFADVEAAARVCRVRLIPHAEIARHAEVATSAAKNALTKTVGALKANNQA